jgi:hypothetical protein
MKSDNTKDRACLLERNQENALKSFKTLNDPDGVVLVIDAGDRLGGELADAVLGEAECQRLCRDCLASRQTPTVVVAIGRAEATRLLGASSPNAGEFFRTPPPPGHFGVAVVTKGGNLFAYAPMAESEPPAPVATVRHGMPAPAVEVNRLTRFLPPDLSTPA